jgi:hypothetical protein
LRRNIEAPIRDGDARHLPIGVPEWSQSIVSFQELPMEIGVRAARRECFDYKQSLEKARSAALAKSFKS